MATAKAFRESNRGGETVARDKMAVKINGWFALSHCYGYVPRTALSVLSGSSSDYGPLPPPPPPPSSELVFKA